MDMKPRHAVGLLCDVLCFIFAVQIGFEIEDGLNALDLREQWSRIISSQPGTYWTVLLFAAAGVALCLARFSEMLCFGLCWFLADSDEELGVPSKKRETVKESGGVLVSGGSGGAESAESAKLAESSTASRKIIGAIGVLFAVGSLTASATIGITVGNGWGLKAGQGVGFTINDGNGTFYNCPGLTNQTPIFVGRFVAPVTFAWRTNTTAAIGILLTNDGKDYQMYLLALNNTGGPTSSWINAMTETPQSGAEDTTNYWTPFTYGLFGACVIFASCMGVRFFRRGSPVAFEGGG